MNLITEEHGRVTIQLSLGEVEIQERWYSEGVAETAVKSHDGAVCICPNYEQPTITHRAAADSKVPYQ